MPLPVPSLDDLDWQELIVDSRERLPARAPAWTDHNFHDPGMTILELLAWLVERSGYRIDQIPDRHRLQFLELLGVERRLAGAATAVVSLSAVVDPVDIAAGDRLRAESDGEVIPFRVDRPCRATTARIKGISTGSGLVPIASGAVVDGEPFEPLGSAGLGQMTVEFGPSAPNGLLNLWFESANAPSDAVTEDGAGPATLTTPSTHHSVTLGWWYGYADAGSVTWAEMDPALVRDGTAALTRSGFVDLDLPGNAIAIRAEVVSGRYDRSPLLASMVVNATAASQVWRRVDGPRLLDGLRLDLGSRHSQRIVDLRSETEATGSTIDWAVMTSQPRSPSEPVAVHDLDQGFLRFSDGRWAHRPPSGDRFSVELDDSLGPGGNLRPGAALWALDDPALAGAITVAASFGATGGSDVESIAAATARAARRLWAHERLVDLAEQTGAASLDDIERETILSTVEPDRAVTLLDFERRAHGTPGVELGRARAWADLDLDVPCADAPGTVSVVVIPFLPVDRPLPTSELLAAVSEHLASAKTLGTRVRVTGPTYHPVSVRVVVDVVDDVDPERILAEVDAAVRSFLDPLTGGPLGRGWPFGRDVYRTEIMALAGAIAGVEMVVDVELWSDDAGGCANVCVPATALVELVDLLVEVGS